MSRRSCRRPASAASRQAERTSTLRPAIRAVPHAWVASNALAYVRPCLARMPKALPPRTSTAGRENIATATATTRVSGSGEDPGERDIEPGGDDEQQRNHDREGQSDRQHRQSAGLQVEPHLRPRRRRGGTREPEQAGEPVRESADACRPGHGRPCIAAALPRHAGDRERRTTRGRSRPSVRSRRTRSRVAVGRSRPRDT